MARLRGGQHKKSPGRLSLLGLAAGGFVMLLWMGTWLTSDRQWKTSQAEGAKTNVVDSAAIPRPDKERPAARGKSTEAHEELPAEKAVADETDHVSSGPVVSGFGYLFSEDNATQLYVKLMIDAKSLMASQAEFEQLGGKFSQHKQFPSKREQLAILRLTDFELVDADAKRCPAVAFVWDDTSSSSRLDEEQQLLLRQAPDSSLFVAPLFYIPSDSPLRFPVSLSWRGAVGLPLAARETPPGFSLRPKTNLIGAKAPRRGPPPLSDESVSPVARSGTTSRAAPAATDKPVPPSQAPAPAELPLVMLPGRVSRTLDAAIVEYLDSVLEKGLQSRKDPKSGLSLGGNSRSTPVLRIDSQDYRVEYVGEQALSYDPPPRSKRNIPHPSGGELLIPRSNIRIEDTVLPAGRRLMRQRNGWAFASTERILDSLQEALRSSPGPLKTRQTALAACELLGADAVPLVHELTRLIEDRATQNSDIFWAARALGAIGDPAALPTLEWLVNRFQGDKEKQYLADTATAAVQRIRPSRPRTETAASEEAKPNESLSEYLSRTLDLAITDGLESEFKLAMSDVIRQNPKLESFTVLGSMFGSIKLRIQRKNYEADHVGSKTRRYTRDPLLYLIDEPQDGNLLRLQADVTIDGITLPAGRVLRRAKGGWALVSTDALLQELGTNLASKDPKERVIAAASCELLGKEADPMMPQLLLVLKAKSPMRDEIAAAVNALKSIGNPKALPALRAASKDKRLLTARSEIHDAIAELSRIQKVAAKAKPTDSADDPPDSAEKTLQAAESQFKRGKQFEDRRNFSRAKEYYEKAIELAPDSAVAQEAQERLDKLP